VESVTVERQWPHTVRIAVVERTAVYAVPKSPSGFLLVDRYGIGYRTVPVAPSALPRAAVDPGQRQLLKPLSTVAGALSPALRAKVDRIEADSRDAIVLRLRNGRTVFWGSADQSELKSRVISALLKVHGTHYDVSAPGNPAVR
jgi:cell division protein FtsQ